MIVSSGIAIISAMMRVTARYLKASTALASSASICSVTFIAPISAPMPAPTRPDTSSPAVERPGFANERDREPGRNHRLGAKPLERCAGVHRQHDADRESGGENQRRRAIAELVDVPDDFPQLVGRARRFDDGARAEH